jgi:tRNA threonylcarbamoyl adenosine modification protein YeaZ
VICLSLDTTGGACTAAVTDAQRVMAQRSDNIGRGHAAHLAPMIAELLEAAGLMPSDIDRIAVCTGPGSFTGQRVGLSFAIGFALPRDIPVLGFSCFDVWAAQKDQDNSKNILALADVRRGELCWAFYEKGRLTHPPQTQKTADAQAAFAQLPPHERLQDLPIDGVVLSRLGLEKDPADYPAAALYSRPPDAKLPGGKLPPAR